MAKLKSDMTIIGIPLKFWRDHATGTILSKVLSDFVNWFWKVFILQYKNGMLYRRFLVLQS